MLGLYWLLNFYFFDLLILFFKFYIVFVFEFDYKVEFDFILFIGVFSNLFWGCSFCYILWVNWYCIRFVSWYGNEVLFVIFCYVFCLIVNLGVFVLGVVVWWVDFVFIGVNVCCFVDVWILLRWEWFWWFMGVDLVLGGG